MNTVVSNDNSLTAWVEYVFDHPVTDPAWHWASDAPQWRGTSEQIATHIAATFEQSGNLLARFSDEQLNQGFWFLLGPASEFMFSLVDPALPLSLRLRALRSFIPLFEQVMAVRCSPHLSHIDEPGVNALNSACYMWWDILPIFGCPEKSERAEFDSEVPVVLQRLLAVPQDACRESALHGLGHWNIHRTKVAIIIDKFLSHSPNLRPELVAYAMRARDENVL